MEGWWCRGAVGVQGWWCSGAGVVAWECRGVGVGCRGCGMGVQGWWHGGAQGWWHRSAGVVECKGKLFQQKAFCSRVCNMQSTPPVTLRRNGKT